MTESPNPSTNSISVPEGSNEQTRIGDPCIVQVQLSRLYGLHLRHVSMTRTHMLQTKPTRTATYWRHCAHSRECRRYSIRLVRPTYAENFASQTRRQSC